MPHPLHSHDRALGRHRLPVLLLLLGLAPWCLAAVAAQNGTGLPVVGLESWLRSIPLWLYLLTFAVLPAFGLPLSLYYLSVGAVLTNPAVALPVAWVCMTLNMALSYGVALWLSRPVYAALRRRGLEPPRLREGTQWRAILLLRASPLPWLVQNWLLALGGARFAPYMFFGVPIQACIGAGLVLVGKSLFQGSMVWLAGGLLLVVLAQMGLVALRRRLQDGGGTPRR
jgi:type IV secretory pathway VirB3-like protein